MKLSTRSFLLAAAAVSISSLPHSSLALATPTAAKLSLKYFDLRGAAETCRVLLALGGEEYEDCRYSFDPKTFKSEAFEAAKESGDLIPNLNRAPVLVTEGACIGQSKAIERYLARRFGLMGDSSEEEAIIDSVAEHCRDVKDAAMRKGFSNFARGKTDEEKAEARKEWFENDLPTLLEKIEAAVQETGEVGFAVGKKTSYADVAIWSLLRDCSKAEVDDTANAAAKCTSLNAIADAIATNPKVSKWLTERPASMF